MEATKVIKEPIKIKPRDDVFVRPLKVLDPQDPSSSTVLEELYDQLGFKRKTVTGRQILSSILWGINHKRYRSDVQPKPPYRFYMEQGQATLDIRLYPNVKDSNSVKRMRDALLAQGWLTTEKGNFNLGEADVFITTEDSPLIIDDLKFVDVPYEKPLVLIGCENRSEGYGGRYRSPDIRLMTTPEIKRQIKTVFAPEVEELNALSQSHEYKMASDGAEDQPRFNNSSCRLTRRFVGGLDGHGGRLNADYMRLSGDQRQHILIDGEPTVEIDVVSCGIRLMASVLDQEVPDEDDLYSVVDHLMPRKDKKLVITALSNHGKLNKTKWPRNWAEEPKLGPIIEQWDFPTFRTALLETYPWFDHLDKDTNYALQVQWLESQSIIDALKSVFNQGYGCLSVHESLIVPVSAKEPAKSAMVTAFEEVAGITPVLAEKAN